MKRNPSNPIAALESFADFYRVEKNANREPIIRCRDGHVYEHGSKSLGVWIESTKPLATFQALRKKIPTLQLHQLGEGEATAVFPVESVEMGKKLLSRLRCFKRRHRPDLKGKPILARIPVLGTGKIADVKRGPSLSESEAVQ